MLLREAFRIQPKEVVALVGGGGKTTAMFRLANELAAQGRHVISTTTTRIFAAQIKLAPHSLVFDPSPAFIRRVQTELSRHPHILIVGETNAEGKAFGISPELVDALTGVDEVDAVIYEADGSRMRPFKAPAAHEPVIASSTTLLVPVVGIQAVGTALDGENVHRPEIVAQLARSELDQAITPEMVARVLTHPEGGLKNKPRAARVTALVNQVESDAQAAAAREIAQRVLLNDAFDAVAIGSAQSDTLPIRETHRRVAAIVTAAGSGTRMQGRIKQLLPWRGRTLIENAIELAVNSAANRVVLVLGARAEEIQTRLSSSALGSSSSDSGGHARLAVVVNPKWEEGHASSIRAALDALPSQIDAAIFINADQPLLTSTVIDQIIQRYRESEASIVVPTYAGKRSSPVLFRRAYFEALRALHGDEGGRDLIARNIDRVERVEFEDARLGTDVDTIEEYEKLGAVN